MWKSIPDYPKYEVEAESGGIRRVPTSGLDSFVRLQATFLMPAGNKAVTLSRKGKCDSRQVAHLVILTFMGLPNGSYRISHKDGDLANCALSNLSVESVPDKDDMPTRVRFVPPKGRGVGRPQAKLTDDEVRDIKFSNEVQTELGRRYGISQQLVSLIRTGKRWQHIKPN